MEELKDRLRDLKQKQEALVEELKSLETQYEKGEISKEEYEEKRNVVERGLVELMDRLAQIGFILGQHR